MLYNEVEVVAGYAGIKFRKARNRRRFIVRPTENCVCFIEPNFGPNNPIDAIFDGQLIITPLVDGLTISLSTNGPWAIVLEEGFSINASKGVVNTIDFKFIVQPIDNGNNQNMFSLASIQKYETIVLGDV